MNKLTRYETITQRIETLESILEPRFTDKDIQKRQKYLNEELKELIIEKQEWDNAFNKNGKVKVSREIGSLLNTIKRSSWNDQFNLISQCKGYSGNGIKCINIWNSEYKLLNDIQPLQFAKILILGYEYDKRDGEWK